jgi:hypothetical protein
VTPIFYKLRQNTACHGRGRRLRNLREDSCVRICRQCLRIYPLEVELSHLLQISFENPRPNRDCRSPDSLGVNSSRIDLARVLKGFVALDRLYEALAPSRKSDEISAPKL